MRRERLVLRGEGRPCRARGRERARERLGDGRRLPRRHTQLLGQRADERLESSRSAPVDRAHDRIAIQRSPRERESW
jgi:hypothetical protein